MNYKQYYRDTWIKVVGRIAIVVISLPLVYMFGFMVGVAVYPKAAIMVGAFWTATIVIIGVIMYSNEYADTGFEKLNNAIPENLSTYIKISREDEAIENLHPALLHFIL